MRVGCEALFIEPDLLVVPVRSIVRPVLESYVLPELSIILVLGAVEVLLETELRVLADDVLPETAVRELAVEVLPDIASLPLVPLVVALLPLTPAIELVVLFAELVRYVPELLPERF